MRIMYCDLGMIPPKELVDDCVVEDKEACKANLLLLWERVQENKKAFEKIFGEI